MIFVLLAIIRFGYYLIFVKFSYNQAKFNIDKLEKFLMIQNVITSENIL